MNEKLQLTISSIKVQEFRRLYTLEEALLKGTIFKELDKPFYGEGGSCHA